MEPEHTDSKEDFVLPDVGEVLGKPIVLATMTFEKVNNERLQEVQALLTELSMYSEEWQKYLDSPEWASTRAVSFAKLYIETLQKQIRLQMRIISHCNETISKMNEVVEKYYDVKEQLMNLDEDTIKKKKVINEIEDYEKQKITKLIKLMEEIAPGESFHEIFIKQKILKSIKDRLIDNTLSRASVKNTYVSVFGQMKRINLDKENLKKIIELYGQFYKAYHECFNEYPFIPGNAEIQGISFI